MVVRKEGVALQDEVKKKAEIIEAERSSKLLCSDFKEHSTQRILSSPKNKTLKALDTKKNTRVLKCINLEA